MRICLQDPSTKNYSLHEELLLASIGATFGVAVFAFVSKGGVNLLLEDEIFLEFIIKSNFILIIGTDEITNTKTIEALNLLIENYPNLQVKAFLNNHGNSTFHPKYCWFKQANGGNIIIGSGNLTQQGLRRNWEAFSVLDLDNQQINAFEQQWNTWFVLNQKYLKSITDPEILEKVAENNRIFKKKKIDKIPIDEQEEEIEAAIDEKYDEEDFEAWYFDNSAEILIAEIPKASNRWNQVNFNRNTFINYFGATPGDNSLRVLFRGLTNDNKLAEVESRQSVSVKSHNWRFELNLAKGKPYPEIGRPTGIFVGISKRMFLYMLIMPTDKEYTPIIELLNTKSLDPVRRLLFSCDEVKNQCPDLAIWNFLQ
jgi:HKD family nuclease